MTAPFRATMGLRIAAEALVRPSTNSASSIRYSSSGLAASGSRLLSTTVVTSTRRIEVAEQSLKTFHVQARGLSRSTPIRRDQLSPEALRKQIEDQLFRRVGQVGQPQYRQPAQYQRFGGGGGGGGGRGGGSFFSRRPQTLVLLALGGGGIYYVFHLEQVPETGRWRFIDVSPAQEHQMGQETFQQTLAEYRGRILPASHPDSKQVRSVASRIVAALDKAVDGQNQPQHTKGDSSMTHHSHGEEGGISYGSHSSGGSGAQSTSFGQASADPSQPATKWEVFVIDDRKQKNAFVLPGGKIFVFTGILPVCANSDGLATVLGHEVAHQVARHSAEKVSGYKVLVAGSFLLDAFGLDIGLSRTLLTLLLSLPNSRKTELEADYLGLRIMSRACFDPREASRLWTRMSESEGGGGGGVLDSAQALLSTHPVSSQRIKNMEKWLPEAMSTREASDCPAPETVAGFRGASGLGQRSFSPF